MKKLAANIRSMIPGDCLTCGTLWICVKMAAWVDTTPLLMNSRIQFTLTHSCCWTSWWQLPFNRGQCCLGPGKWLVFRGHVQCSRWNPDNAMVTFIVFLMRVSGPLPAWLLVAVHVTWCKTCGKCNGSCCSFVLDFIDEHWTDDSLTTIPLPYGQKCPASWVPMSGRFHFISASSLAFLLCPACMPVCLFVCTVLVESEASSRRVFWFWFKERYLYSLMLKICGNMLLIQGMR